jgi:hypothetical protein
MGRGDKRSERNIKDVQMIAMIPIDHSEVRVHLSGPTVEEMGGANVVFSTASGMKFRVNMADWAEYKHWEKQQEMNARLSEMKSHRLSAPGDFKGEV